MSILEIQLTSFGYLHSGPPATADAVADVREDLRDPAAASAILDLTGLDPQVQDVVRRTPGAVWLLNSLAIHVALRNSRHVAIGCAGGRHRSVALVEMLADTLRRKGYAVSVTHLHVHLPRVIKTVEGR